MKEQILNLIQQAVDIQRLKNCYFLATCIHINRISEEITLKDIQDFAKSKNYSTKHFKNKKLFTIKALKNNTLSTIDIFY